MANGQPFVESPGHDAAERNRKTVRVLVAIVLVLVVATVLVGIRW